MNDAQALLASAESLLRDDLAAHAKGDQRYKALLSANAVAMAAREIEQGAAARQARVDTISVADIRAGRIDGDAAAADAILREAAIRAHIADPAALDDAERVRFVPDSD